MSVNYRKFRSADTEAAHRLSLSVEWPHRFEDWLLLQRRGSGYVAEDRGAVIGTVLAWKHDRRYAWLGMFIVDPARQGRGIGRKLISHALEELEGRAVLLNATPAGRPLFERLGFKVIDKVERHQGVAHNVPIVPLAPGERLRPLDPGDAARLVSLATSAAGMSRALVIERLLESAEGIVLVRGGEPIGFAFCRRFGRGDLIGPVVAPDVQRAKVIISYWAAMYRGKFLRIDVNRASGLGDWLDGLGLKRIETLVTLLKGTPPAPDPGVRTFALVSQSLG
jgi:predicted N-acetyltransferase YhbS